MAKLSRKKDLVRLGKCMICNESLHRDTDFITTEEGYCHRECLI